MWAYLGHNISGKRKKKGSKPSRIHIEVLTSRRVLSNALYQKFSQDFTTCDYDFSAFFF